MDLASCAEVSFLTEKGYAAYAATKEAIWGRSHAAAREWGQFGIRVNTISPCAVTDTVKYQEGQIIHVEKIILLYADYL